MLWISGLSLSKQGNTPRRDAKYIVLIHSVTACWSLSIGAWENLKHCVSAYTARFIVVPFSMLKEDFIYSISMNKYSFISWGYLCLFFIFLNQGHTITPLPSLPSGHIE